MKTLPWLSLILFPLLAHAGVTNEALLLKAAENSPVVRAYVSQPTSEPDDFRNLRYVKAPKTVVRCTLMMRDNSCSMSFRAVNEAGATIFSGAVHYNGVKDTYSVFRLLDGAPEAGSDFEAFSRGVE